MEVLSMSQWVLAFGQVAQLDYITVIVFQFAIEHINIINAIKHNLF